MADLARQQSIDNHSGRSKRIAFSTLIFALTLVLVSAASSAAHLKGRVKHGIYSSPATNFTVPVPSGMGMRINDGYSKEADSEFGAVSFHDDWGTLVAIHYDSVPPEAIPILAQPGQVEATLGSWLEMVAMPTWFLNASPESRILHQSAGSFEGMEVIVAQVKIPGGSSMVTLDAAGEHRLDSTRGLVIFHHGRFIYMLGTELTGLHQILGSGPAQKTDATENAADSGDEWMKFVNTLRPLYQSIKFLE